MAVIESSALRQRAGSLWRITGRLGVHEVVVVVVSFLIYFVIRGSVVARAGEALVRTYHLVSLEQSLGIYRELTMQSWIIDNYALIKAMNWIYFWGHMPLIIVFAIWLYIWHRRAYRLVRNAFLASGAIAVLLYWAFPVAPPRLIPFGGFVDTVAVLDRLSYDAQSISAFVNPFAAMPSLHFGWSMLIALAVFWVTDNWVLKVFGLLWPVAMFFAVVMTANHFFTDIAAGAAVCFAGFGIAIAIERFQPAERAWALIRGRSFVAQA